MKKFYVTIVETLSGVVEIEAEDSWQAEDIAQDRWKNGDIVLTAENFDEVNFEANDEDWDCYGNERR